MICQAAAAAAASSAECDELSPSASPGSPLDRSPGSPLDDSDEAVDDLPTDLTSDDTDTDKIPAATCVTTSMAADQPRTTKDTCKVNTHCDSLVIKIILVYIVIFQIG